MMMSYLKILILLTLTASLAQAVKMDYETHDDLINRLESTLSSLAKSANERPAVIHRLAGLYADRARLKGMKEVEQNCNDCLNTKKDRETAIRYFEESLSKQSKSKQGEILVQIAHLQSLNQKTAKSQKIFRNIVKKGTRVYSSRVIALAHLNLAEEDFRKGQFKSALKGYKKALKYDLPDRALAQYRIAWCYLNIGQEKRAIANLRSILKNPELVRDPSFHEDVSSDLALLMPRSFLGNKQIQEMLSLSPESKRKENLKTMAEEANRLGKKGSAILVWSAYAKEPGFTTTEQIDIQIRLAQAQFDLGKTTLAQAEYKKALDLWQSTGCKGEEVCKEIQNRYRNFVTSWNKIRKVNPDKNLLAAYQAYLVVFQDDLDMAHWGALTARHLNDYRAGVTLFRKASELARQQKNQKLFEGSLLGEIELAEKSKNKSLMENAYTNYIQVNSGGEKVWDIRYARAVLWADLKKHQQSFSELHTIATSNEKQAKKFQSPAAELALDQLAKLNDHEALEKRSQEYAKLIPSKKSPFLKIARTAVLNQVTKLADSSLHKALNKLDEYPRGGASTDELVKLHKNRILLSQQIKDVNRAEAAAQDLYRLKGLSDSDNEYALGVLAWAAELKLDFKSAYHLHRKLTPKKTSANDELKLAVLSELAGLNSYKHYNAYLKKERDTRSKNIVRVNLIKRASNPWIPLNKHLNELKKSPDLLASVVLEAHAVKHYPSKVKTLLKTTKIAKYPEGQTLARQFKLDDLKSFDRKIAKHRLNSRNDRLLQNSLKARLKLLDQADREVKSAMRSKDWSLQVIALAINARENERLQQDLLALPAPRGLNKNELAQYKKLMSEQSEIYRSKAANISDDIQALFSQDNVLDGMSKVLQNASRPVRKILERELSIAESLVRGRAKKRLTAMLKLPSQRPSFQEITVARNAVREDPFNIKKVSRLQELEGQRGEGTMVGYLDSRIAEIKKGAKL